MDCPSTDDGQTPLLLACRHSDAVAVRLLIASGARASVTNHKGVSPLEMAAAALTAAMATSSLSSAISKRRHHHQQQHQQQQQQHKIRKSQLVFDIVLAATVQEALQSMAGLTLVKLLLSHVETRRTAISTCPSSQFAHTQRVLLADAVNRNNNNTSSNSNNNSASQVTADYAELARPGRDKAAPTQAHLRASVTVLEEALREACMYADMIHRACKQLGPSAAALKLKMRQIGGSEPAGMMHTHAGKGGLTPTAAQLRLREADGGVTGTTVVHALRLFDQWRETRDAPGCADRSLGRRTLDSLITCGVVLKTHLQQQLVAVSSNE